MIVGGTVTATITVGDGPGVAVAPDGNRLRHQQLRQQRVEIVNGVVTATITAGAYPPDVAVASDGTAYVTNYPATRCRRLWGTRSRPRSPSVRVRRV